MTEPGSGAYQAGRREHSSDVRHAIRSLPPKPAADGCPSGNPKQIANMSLPTKLVVDRFESNRRVLSAGTQSFQLRVHVTSTSPCARDVQGALVYGTAAPFNQFTIEVRKAGENVLGGVTGYRLVSVPVNLRG